MQELWGAVNPERPVLLKLDFWHWLERFEHGLHSPGHIYAPKFFCAIRIACFSVHAGDFDKLLIAFCDIFEYTHEQAIRDKLIPLSDIKTFCKRGIFGPTELEHNLEMIYVIFSHAKYSDSDIHLFGKNMPAVWAAQLVHVRNGCLSDPEGIPLYREVRKVKYRNSPKHILPVWATARSTSRVEATHPSLHKIERSSTMGVALAHASSSDAAYVWDRNQLKHQGKPRPFLTCIEFQWHRMRMKKLVMSQTQTSILGSIALLHFQIMSFLA